ncbi:MAG: hypothetical protein QOI02_1330 [Actinomycetota bacterium]|nr:hypothetical protein [Actinomycetota bacterium]
MEENTETPGSTPEPGEATSMHDAHYAPPVGPPADPSTTPYVFSEPQELPRRSVFRRHPVASVISGAAILAILTTGGGVAAGLGISNALKATSSQSQALNPSQNQSPFGQGPGQQGGAGGNYRQTTPFGGAEQQSSTLNATAATDTQKAGVVTIVSELDFSTSSQAAGTGIILSSNGLILTNNHVIDGSTAIKVTVESTGKTYTAKVVGSDSKDDIAVLQLAGATGLTPATRDTSTVSVGDTATSVGNAGGTGNLVAATGKVTKTNESITVGSQYSSAKESLTGLIEVAADVVSGDSGGPLVATDGDVIGVVTAASTGSQNVTGYAIPIATAMKIATSIESGVPSTNIQLGTPAFLGVSIATKQGTKGVTVQTAIPGTPAAASGLKAGDVITSFGGTSVKTPADLTAAVRSHSVGDSVKVSFTTASGKKSAVTLTLIAGPAS